MNYFHKHPLVQFKNTSVFVRLSMKLPFLFLILKNIFPTKRELPKSEFQLPGGMIDVLGQLNFVVRCAEFTRPTIPQEDSIKKRKKSWLA